MIRLSSLVAAVALLASCGGRTGLEVMVVPPDTFTVPGDFDSLFIQVDADTQNVGRLLPVTADTPRPYRIYVWSEESSHNTAKVLVRLRKAGAGVKEDSKVVAISEGEIKTVLFDFGE